MEIKNIKTETMLRFVLAEDETVAFKVTFFDLYTDKSFFVKSKELYEYASKAGRPLSFEINFFLDDASCNCTGRTEKVFIRSGSYLTLINQTSEIERTNPRRHQRESIATRVILYRLPEDEFNSNNFVRELSRVELSCMSFDISGGGFCLMSNDALRHPGEPHYLAEFTLNGNELFVLPVRLVRSDKAPPMSRVRYDYGFAFQYDNLPNEERRLIGALINVKMALVKR